MLQTASLYTQELLSLHHSTERLLKQRNMGNISMLRFVHPTVP